MLELYTSECAVQELVYISYFLYFEEKKVEEKLVFEENQSDQVKDKFKKIASWDLVNALTGSSYS